MIVNSRINRDFSIFIVDQENEEGFDLKSDKGELICFDTREIIDLIVVLKQKHLAKQNLKASKKPLKK